MGPDFWNNAIQLGATFTLAVVILVMFGKILIKIVEIFRQQIEKIVSDNQVHVQSVVSQFEVTRALDRKSAEERSKQMTDAFDRHAEAFNKLNKTLEAKI
jgi:hypothetical protein